VWLFHADYHYITSLSTRVLISFAVESVLIFVWCALIDIDLNDLLLFNDLFAIACLALVGFVDNFTLTSAIIAWA